MKSYKLIVAGLVALAAAVSASAQTYIKVTGSSAMRKSFAVAAYKSLNGAQGAQVGSSIDGANKAVMKGTLKVGGESVVIQMCWAGSIGGIQTVVQGLNGANPTGGDGTKAWLSATQSVALNTLNWSGTAWTVNGAVLTDTAGQPNTALYDGAATAAAAMSDTAQGGSGFTSVALTPWKVGYVDFLWLKGPFNAADTIPAASYNRVTNMTWNAANALFTNGLIPMAQMTGNSLDYDYDVLLLGRDPDSGTRLAAQLEAQFNPNSPVTQWQPAVNTGVTPNCLRNQVAWNNPLPIAGSLGGSGVGNGGYSSGGTLAGIINKPVCTGQTDSLGLPFIFVSYAGRSDANAALGGTTPAVWLDYDGVDYQPTTANMAANRTLTIEPVTYGAYTFWSLGHLLLHPTYAVGTITHKWVSQMGTTYLPADANLTTIAESEMFVKRAVDGGVVLPK